MEKMKREGENVVFPCFPSSFSPPPVWYTACRQQRRRIDLIWSCLPVSLKKRNSLPSCGNRRNLVAIMRNGRVVFWRYSTTETEIQGRIVGNERHKFYPALFLASQDKSTARKCQQMHPCINSALRFLSAFLLSFREGREKKH